MCYNIVGYLSLYIDEIDVLSSLVSKTQKDVENTMTEKREKYNVIVNVLMKIKLCQNIDENCFKTKTIFKAIST